MDHSIFTTQKLSRRSTKSEVEDAVRQCAKLLILEYKETGKVGITRPESFQHASEISLGLAVTSARRVVGDKVPAFPWNKTLPKGADFLWDKGRFPYSFLNETHGDYERRKQEHQREIDNPWKVDMNEVAQEVEAEAQTEEGQGWKEYLASLSDKERAVLEAGGISSEGLAENQRALSARGKIQAGLDEKDEKRGVHHPESLSAKRDQKLAESGDLSEASSSDKIKTGLRERKRQLGLPVDE